MSAMWIHRNLSAAIARGRPLIKGTVIYALSRDVGRAIGPAP